MAYQTGTTTGAADLLGKLATFAAANGWTIDDAVASGKFALHKGTCYASFRYDPTKTTGAQPVSVHQALGHIPGNMPGDHPNDSNNGYNTTTATTWSLLDDERHVDLGLSSDELPSTYHFFEDDNGTRSYIHVAVAKTDQQHRHFGFGWIDKFGVWTGGEYVYGQAIATSAIGDVTYNSFVSIILDGRMNLDSIANGARRASATIRVDAAFPEQAGDRWQMVGAGFSYDSTNLDSDGNPTRGVQGGYRGGPLNQALGNFSVNRDSGFVVMLPITLFYTKKETSPTPNRARYLGAMPDVKGIILENLVPGEEFTVGSDTWIAFPSFQKADDFPGSGPPTTRYQGIAYKKVTT